LPLNHDPTLLEYERSAAGDDTSEDEADDVGQNPQEGDPPGRLGLDSRILRVFANSTGLRIENDGFSFGYSDLVSVRIRLFNDLLQKILKNLLKKLFHCT
jgi:hypothetical protein